MNNVDTIISISTNSRDYLQALYLDYLNNFISIQTFANVYGLSESQAETIVSVGRKIHKDRTGYKWESNEYSSKHNTTRIR